MHTRLEGHTVKRFDGELGTIHLRVLEMGGLVADQLSHALRAIKKKSLRDARQVVKRDSEADELEVKTDEEIASILARRCPVARDLRAVLVISKAITDLERIGDEAVKIAGLAIQMYDSDVPAPSQALLRDIYTVGREATSMLTEALQAFDDFDAERAEKLVASYGELDQEFQSSLRRLTTFILEDPRNLGHAIKVVLIVKALERVGDHAKNLAEYVIYLVSGQDVRSQETSTPLEQKDSGDSARDHGGDEEDLL